MIWRSLWVSEAPKDLFAVGQSTFEDCMVYQNIRRTNIHVH